MPQESPTQHAAYFYCYLNLKRLLLGLVATSLMAVPAMAADMSGWSDKTVCRLLGGAPDNAEFLAEALQRELTCGSGTKSSGKKQKAKGKSLPKNQGIVVYALNMPPKLKAQLLSQSIIKTEFDFSPSRFSGTVLVHTKRISWLFCVKASTLRPGTYDGIEPLPHMHLNVMYELHLCRQGLFKLPNVPHNTIIHHQQ